jgi:hypothetical protein
LTVELIVVVCPVDVVAVCVVRLTVDAVLVVVVVVVGVAVTTCFGTEVVTVVVVVGWATACAAFPWAADWVDPVSRVVTLEEALEPDPLEAAVPLPEASPELAWEDVPLCADCAEDSPPELDWEVLPDDPFEAEEDSPPEDSPELGWEEPPLPEDLLCELDEPWAPPSEEDLPFDALLPPPLLEACVSVEGSAPLKGLIEPVAVTDTAAPGVVSGAERPLTLLVTFTAPLWSRTMVCAGPSARAVPE